MDLSSGKVINAAILEEDLREITAVDLPFVRLKNKTILITGGNGFLPAYLIDSLMYLKKSHGYDLKIYSLVRDLQRANVRFHHYRNEPNLKFLHQDVCAPLPLDLEPVEFVIHAASQASPAKFKTDPVGTLRANSLGTLNLLEWSRHQSIEAFLNFSSGEIYGRVANQLMPIAETTFGPLDCNTVRSSYAESKRFSETACTSFFVQFGLPTIIVRPFHTYGPGMSLTDGRVFADFVADVVQNRNISVKGDGSARRTFCYLSDATAGFLTALLKGLPGEAYNIGAPEYETSIGDLARTLVQMFPDKHLDVIHESRSATDGYLPSDIDRYTPDTSKVKKLGWQPVHNIKDGFRRTVEAFRVD